MHTKDLMTKILSEKGGKLPLWDLLHRIMIAEPRRPISFSHFQDCLERLKDTKKIETFIEGGEGVGRLLEPTAK